MPYEDVTDHSQEARDTQTAYTPVSGSREVVVDGTPVSQRETQAETKDSSAVTTAQSQEKAPSQPASPPSLFEAVHVPMPAGGLQQLAVDLHPEDKDNAEEMSKHVAHLLTLNRDTLRNEFSHIVGTFVRIK